MSVPISYLGRLPAIVMLVALAACSGGGGSDSNGNGNTQVDPVVLDAVLALFSANGADWNDYVDGADLAGATDTPCDGRLDDFCLHGGERRVVAATGKTSCAGLTASDALAAFAWECDGSTNPVRFISTGLADGVHLSDLIDFGQVAFKPNLLTVFENANAWGATPSTVWWSNPVVVDHDGGSLAAASTMYLVTSDTTSDYTIDESRIALVVQPGVTLTGTGGGAAVIASGGVSLALDHHFLWIEGDIDADGNDRAINVRTRHSALRNVSARNGAIDGIAVGGEFCRLRYLTATNNGDGNLNGNGHPNGIGISVSATRSTVSDVSASNNLDCGVTVTALNNVLTRVTVTDNGHDLFATGGLCLDGASIVRASDVIANHNKSYGILLRSSGASATTGNSLSNVTANNNRNAGITLQVLASQNRFSGVTTSNNGSNGIELMSGQENRLVGLTANNNGNFGLSVNGSPRNLLMGVAAGNNGAGGIFIRSGSDNTLVAGAAAGDSHESLAVTEAVGIRLDTASNNVFTGPLKVGNNTVGCMVAGGTDPGLVDGTCANQGGSDAALTTGASFATSFVGKVNADDAQNASDADGTADFAAVGPAFDWTHFDNPYRGWGPDGSAFPNRDHTRSWTLGTGRIWDWSVAALDAGDSGNPALLGVLALPDGNDTLTHDFSGVGFPVTFLRHAVEIADNIGNDDMLCESNEVCLYTPNIGSYQGHGDLVSAGAFTDGTLTGIMLMRYASNGR